MTRISRPAAGLAIAAAAATVLLLAGLHVLSPEFAPAWRMVSEYANGHYGWVLSLMFAAWALSTWALVVAIWSEAGTKTFKAGLALLAVAGLGEALAAVFDINHDTMHAVAGALGILGLPIAAMLVSASLARTETWAPARRALLWTANLTWVSLVLLGVTFALLVASFSRLGAMPAQAPAVLPPGVIGLVGWANRLLVVLYCTWAVTVAWQAIKLHAQASLRLSRAT